MKKLEPHGIILFPHCQKGNAHGSNAWCLRLWQVLCQELCILDVSHIGERGKGGHVHQTVHVTPVGPVGVGANENGRGARLIEPGHVGGLEFFQGSLPSVVSSGTARVVINDNEIPLWLVILIDTLQVAHVVLVLKTRVCAVVNVIFIAVVIVTEIVVIVVLELFLVRKTTVLSKDELTDRAGAIVVNEKAGIVVFALDVSVVYESIGGHELWIHAVSGFQESPNGGITVQTRVLMNTSFTEGFHEPRKVVVVLHGVAHKGDRDVGLSVSGSEKQRQHRENNDRGDPNVPCWNHLYRIRGPRATTSNAQRLLQPYSITDHRNDTRSGTKARQGTRDTGTAMQASKKCPTCLNVISNCIGS